VATAIELEIEASLGEGNATAHIEPCDRTTCLPSGNCTILSSYAPVQGSLAEANLRPAPADHRP
jgi:hypothetical protein